MHMCAECLPLSLSAFPLSHGLFLNWELFSLKMEASEPQRSFSLWLPCSQGYRCERGKPGFLSSCPEGPELSPLSFYSKRP